MVETKNQKLEIFLFGLVQKSHDKKINIVNIILASLFAYFVLADYRTDLFTYLKLLLFILFFISTLFYSIKSVITILNNNKKKYLLIFFYVIVWFFINLEVLGLERDIRNVLSNLLLFSPVYIFDYFKYINRNNNIKFLFNINLFIILFVCVRGIITSTKIPNIMRFLAWGDIPVEFAEWRYLGIGGYGFAYSMVFISAGLVLLYTKLSNMQIKKVFFFKVIILSAIIILFSAQIEHQYTIAIALQCMLVLVIYIYNKQFANKKRLFKFLLIILLIISAMLYSEKIIVGNMFNYISEISSTLAPKGINFINSRFKQLSEFFLTDATSVEKLDGVTGRFYVYKLSFDTFIHNPLIGVISFRALDEGTDLWQANNLVGGHSMLLDSLARYGLIFTSILIILIWYLFKDLSRNYKNHNTSIWIISITFLIFSTVNLSLSPAIIMSIFYMFPLMLEYISIHQLKPK